MVDNTDNNNNPSHSILIVDDEPDIRGTLQEFLEDEGYNVITAESGAQALTIIESETVNLVLTDLLMPGMDGIELTKQISRTKPELPVVLMTAYASIEYAVESIKAGALDFIPKPFKFNHTLFIIQKALETHQLKETAQLSEYYKKLSNIDALTVTFNRRYFKDALQREIERHSRHNRILSLLIADIDNFKNVNDEYGHLVGDTVLQKTAAILKKSIRGCDILARYGGEEFTIILPETSESEACMVAERILQSVNSYNFSENDNCPVNKITITIGLSTFPVCGLSAADLIDTADKALYQGKKDGKNCIRISVEKSIPKAR